jgi:hypothetical protein
VDTFTFRSLSERYPRHFILLLLVPYSNNLPDAWSTVDGDILTFIMYFADLNWAEGPHFVSVNLDRDQDVWLEWSVLAETFDRIVSLGGSRDHYMAMLLQRPWYFDLTM